jgi:hypothetical protein
MSKESERAIAVGLVKNAAIPLLLKVLKDFR